ncbi:MAG: DUF2975 domain-containing protein [Pseudomonadota bacterium]
MTDKRTDLLSVTRALVRFAQMLVVLVMALGAVIFIGLLNGTGKPMPVFTGTLASMDPKTAVLALRIGSIGALCAGAALLPLLRELIRIIDSTRLGDPFIPENARRLRLIGWLLLAFNFCVSSTVSLVTPPRSGITFPFVSLSALLMVLLVFVLARIFESGSQMRAELKDTV